MTVKNAISQVGRGTPRAVSVLSAASLLIFPWGPILVASGIALVGAHKIPGARHLGEALSRHAHKKTVSLFTDSVELGRRSLTVGKNPLVSASLGVAALFVGVVPLIPQLVFSSPSALAYGVHGFLAAPAALLVAPAGIHHFRSLKRYREKKAGGEVDLATLRGPYKWKEHFAAEANDLGAAIGVSKRVGLKVLHLGARVGGWGFRVTGKGLVLVGKVLYAPIGLGGRGIRALVKQVHPTAIKLKAEKQKLREELFAEFEQENKELREKVETMSASRSRTRRFQSPDVEVAKPQPDTSPSVSARPSLRKAPEKEGRGVKL